MKLLISLSLLLFSNISGQNQRTGDCTKFKNGTFSTHSELTNKSYSITRKDSLQIESEIGSGKVSEWKVTWLNDCEYHMLLIKDNYGLLKSPKLKRIPAFTYKIISTTDNYYIFENKYDNLKKSRIDTVWKVD
jgi:hypothetical protein